MNILSTFLFFSLTISTVAFSQNVISRAGALDVYKYEIDPTWVTNNIFAFYDSLTQKEYVIVSHHDTTCFGIMGIYDITIPSNIQLVSCMNSSPFGVKVFNNHAYTVRSTPGGFIFDLSDLSNPIYIGAMPIGNHTITLDERGYLYSSYKIARLDDPANPTIVNGFDFSSIPQDAGWHDAIVKQNILIVFGGPRTLIFDIVDPEAPILIGDVYDPSIKYAHSGDLTEDGKHLFICDELNDMNSGTPDITIWNIEDLSNVVKVGEIDDTSAVVHNAYIKGNFMYVAYYKAGFRIYDITNPAQPYLVDQYQTFGGDSTTGGGDFRGCFDVYPYLPSGNIVALDNDSGLFVFSIDYLSLNTSTKYSKKQTTIVAYPNPFVDFTEIHMSGVSFPAELSIYNLQGVEVQKYTVNSPKLNIGRSNLASGLYIASIQDNKNIFEHIKLVIE
ncbi:choice-of-anchor B family protein [Bacteroidales bacterium AH-315-I05]|nr:choice-of-anchor B family protein [Bacteroidales bacterium AH-315-I05]